MPALIKAYRIQDKAAQVKFEWENIEDVWKKVEEELDEFKEAKTKEHQAEELGDLMFCIVNYARLAGHDTEEILTSTNKKFERRFKAMEQSLAQSGKKLEDSSLDEMLIAWNKGKTHP